MKIFNLIGIAAAVWVGYIIVTSKSHNEGFAKIKKSLYDPIDPIDRSREIVVPSTSVIVEKSVDKTSSPTIETVDVALTGLNGKDAVATQKVINDVDWGKSAVSSSPDQFTKGGRAQYSDWSTNTINAGWSASAVL